MKNLIISHWDTDGIISSALILRHYPSLETPVISKEPATEKSSDLGSAFVALRSSFDIHISPIGTFTLAPDVIRTINEEKYEHIFIIDYALQKDIVEQLSAVKITVIDHHFTGKATNAEYFNKVIDGASPEDYPCCVMSVVDYVNKVKGESGTCQGNELSADSPTRHSSLVTPNSATAVDSSTRPSPPASYHSAATDDFLLESSVAAVGDKEHKILKNPRFKERIELLEQEQGIAFEQLARVKELIDSNYMSGNLEGAKQTIRDIAENGALSVLENEKLSHQVEDVKKEKELLLQTEPEKITDHIWFYELNTEYQLLSAVTRGLSKAHPDKIIVTRLGGNVYIRRDEYDIDLKNLIDYGQPKGWDIGGKHEVAGIAGCSEEAFDEALEWLKDNS